MSPRRLLRPCPHSGCPNLVERGHCAQHQPVQDETRRERDRAYQQERTDTEEQAFYNSAAWRRLRAWYIRRQPACERCSRKGRLTQAALVHHKVAVKQGGNRLAADNLESVCQGCHMRAHRSKDN